MSSNKNRNKVYRAFEIARLLAKLIKRWNNSCLSFGRNLDATSHVGRITLVRWLAFGGKACWHVTKSATLEFGTDMTPI